MARIDVTTTKISRWGGLDLDAAATAPTIDGDVIDTGAVTLYVENVSAAQETVTIPSPITVEGLDVQDIVVNVPAGARMLLPALPKRIFGRPVGDVDEGRAYVDYSSAAAFVRAVVEL